MSPEEISTPLPPTVAPPSARPAVPYGMWLIFIFALVPVGVIGNVIFMKYAATHLNSGWFVASVIGGACAGLVGGVPMAGGLLIAERLVGGTVARVFAGVGFAVVLAVAVAGLRLPFLVLLVFGEGMALALRNSKATTARIFGGLAYGLALAVLVGICVAGCLFCNLMASPIQM